MLPARTNSPPNAFTPRYFGPESRPLREEPTPFLCAMRATSAELHVGDADFGERLPVAGVAAVTGAAGGGGGSGLWAPSLPPHLHPPPPAPSHPPPPPPLPSLPRPPPPGARDLSSPP